MLKRWRKLGKRFNLRLEFSKREKFALIVFLLTTGLLVIQLSPSFWRYPLTGILILAAYLLCAWGWREDLSGVEWLTLFILPTMYTGAISFFYFLLPVRWLTRLPTAVLFALGMYAILLVENIYNVAAVRTIQLLRAAHSVGLLATLFTVFMLLATITSLRLPFYGNFFLVFLVLFPLILQALWVMELEPGISRPILIYTLALTLILAELAFVFSFWPMPTTIEALFLTTVGYSLVGMTQQHLIGRLFKRTAWEFMAVSAIVFLLVLLTTKWGG